MQSVHEGDRVLDPERGAGCVERLLHQSTRGLNGAACVEVFVRFDSGELLPVCVDDLLPEDDDDGR